MNKKSQNSLSEVHETVVIPAKVSSWRRWLAITGPALMVAVGYMDPGNWATDIAGGSRYSYALIWVLLMSNLMAILLQSLAARLGIVSRRDLAQVCHEDYPPIVNIPLYILAEIAITACDLAEVLGSAIALQLLFGLPLFYGVILTALDTFLLLLLSHAGIRKLESVVVSLVGTIGVAFFIEILLGKPDWRGIVHGFVPSLPDASALYIAIGILGATVMPHNLYLHSSLVQTRKIGRDREEVKKTLRWNTIDTSLSLNIAFLINAAILVMAASVFHRNGYFEVAEIQDAHRLLEPLLGASIAPIAFAIALLASGQSSTITGTLAGQIVMEGYLNLRIRPWLRRLITRLLAVVPAILVIAHYGENSTGAMLVLSQVILSLQLPFAIIPLIHSVADKKRMGEFVIGRKLQALAWIVAGIILSLNVKLIVDQIGAWITEAGDKAWLIEITVVPLTVGLGILLLYVMVEPWLRRQNGLRIGSVHRQAPLNDAKIQRPAPYKRIAVALDFSGKDEKLLAESLRFVDKAKTKLTLLHVVESPVARRLGTEGEDSETLADRERLEALSQMMREHQVETDWQIGSGEPASELAKMINGSNIEMVLVGGHGHSGVSDLIHGTVISDLRHHIKANVMIVPISD
ncbi:MAG: iron/manganese transporter [Anaerolineae bacterium]|nr:MAG: iron/manganese transporter [Anaerolineae bacterium]WKZ45441.1 MAG: Nramp family divalent metal transporter [Anaerolineales bacterium]